MPGHLALTKATPVVMLVLDRSSSMGFRFDGTNRWRALVDGLEDALPPVDQVMQLGSLTYPMGQGGAACIVSLVPEFQPAKGNVQPILSRMRASNPSGSTPTALAVDIAGMNLGFTRTTVGGKAMILATDGAPDCNAALDPSTCTCVSNTGTSNDRCEVGRCLDDVATTERVAHFADAGIPTYVIGITNGGDPTLSRVLNDLAVAGGRPQKTGATRFYSAGSKAQLDAALVAIRDSVGACVFLARSVPDRDEDMTLTAAGLGEIPHDPTGHDGWAWSDRLHGELVVSGPSCDQLVAHMNTVIDAEVACETP